MLLKFSYAHHFLFFTQFPYTIHARFHTVSVLFIHYIQEGHGSVRFQPVLDWTRFSRFRFGRFGRFLFHIDSGSWILQVDIQTKVLHLQE